MRPCRFSSERSERFDGVEAKQGDNIIPFSRTESNTAECVVNDAGKQCCAILYVASDLDCFGYTYRDLDRFENPVLARRFYPRDMVVREKRYRNITRADTKHFSWLWGRVNLALDSPTISVEDKTELLDRIDPIYTWLLSLIGETQMALCLTAANSGCIEDMEPVSTPGYCWEEPTETTEPKQTNADVEGRETR